MKGRDVEQLVILLLKNKVLTADKIPTDSVFDANVEDAVKIFQSTEKLSVDGKVDYRTLLLLKMK